MDYDRDIKQLKIKVYWDVMLCHWTSSSWCWEGS